MKDTRFVAVLLALLKTQMTTAYEISVIEECQILLAEEWRDVKGYEGLYQVSNLGRARSFHNQYGRVIKPVLTQKGYLQVTLSKNGKSRTRPLHILVAQAFIPNPLNKPQVNHMDGNPLNNRFDNLEWATSKENIQHAYKTGLAKSGANHKNAKLTEYQVKEIRRDYIKGDPQYGAMAFAEKFNVNVGVIWGVIYHKTYKNVKDDKQTEGDDKNNECI